jgi:peptidoglycan/xylan/chitin deacetylase (PgdA/CDA1 family)
VLRVQRTSPVRRLDRRELPGIYLAVLVLALTGPYLPRTQVSVPPVPVTAPVPVAAAVHPGVLVHVASARPGDRVVALTFDDGPDPQWTPRVLNLLHRFGAVATFCVVGNQVARHEDIVRAVAAAGMRLCDHSRSHDEQLFTRPPAQITDEIVSTRDAVWAAADVHVGYFRAPGGYWSPELQRIAAENQMQPLGWSVDPWDWRQPGVAAIVATVKRQVRPGAVVLLHDGGGPRGQTVEALEQLLPWFVAQGYRFGFPTP